MGHASAKRAVSVAALALGLGLALAPCLTEEARAAPELGAPLPTVDLSGEAGGRVDGRSWSSATLKDKVSLVFYVAPSHRDDNQELKDALTAASFPEDKFATTAVINLAASWLPNSVLNSAIKSNQERYPKVTYVKDMDKSLVKQWHLADNAFSLLVFNKQGQVVASKEGELSKNDISALVALIKKNVFAH